MSKKVYECVQADLHSQDCLLWQEVVVQTPLPLSKADAYILTLEIISFMVFVFIIKQIQYWIK